MAKQADTDTLADWMDPAPAPRRDTSRIGGYRIVRELGAGGMGTVYEAEQVALSRSVALKVLAPHLSISLAAVTRFRREAEAAGRQRHPGLVAVYDVGSEDGVHYIAQELVEGGQTLEDRIDHFRRQAQLPANYYRQTAELFLAVAEALQHAHDSGVTHRDIKPSNILLTAAGRPKVTDFGLARVEDTLGLSRTGVFAGTPQYCSPEQVVAKPDAIDHRSDIFSLGATLYMALCFHRPFDGDTVQHVLARVQNEDPVDPRQLRALIPSELSAICLHALEKLPERRYPTMAAMADDLRRYLNDEPIVARPPGPLRRGWKWLRRHPVITAAGAVALLALVLVSGLLLQIKHKNEALQVEVATAQAALDFMADMLQRADPYEARGAEVTVKEVLDQGAEQVAGSLDLQPEARARLMQVMGNVYREMGNYQEAERMLGAALELREASIGPQHTDTFASRDALAQLRWRQGQYAEAEALIRRNYTLMRETLGDEHPDTLNAQNALGALCWQQDRYEEAEQYYLGALQGRRALDDGAATLETVNNLAVLYKVMGRYEEAEPLYLEDLEGSRRLLGSDHPDTLVTLHNVASFYTMLGRYAEAEPLYLEAVEGRRRVLGETHPGTINTESKLAALYASQGRYPEALALFEGVLATRRDVLGETHPATLGASIHIAQQYARMGRTQEAEQLYTASLGAARQLQPGDPTLTATVLLGLGDLYESLGQYRRASPLYDEALALRREVFGELHPDTLEALANTALILWRQNEVAQAESLFQQALEGSTQALGAEHSQTLNIANSLASLYLGEERYDLALPLFQRVSAGSLKTLGEEHQLTLVAANNVAALYRRMGKLSEAEALYRTTLQTCQERTGEHNPLVYQVMSGLVLTLLAEGKSAEARPLALEALEGNQRLLGAEHPNTVQAAANLEAVGGE